MDAGQYLNSFIDETREYLQNFKGCIEALEKQPGRKSILIELNRVTHSLTGMAETMGFYRMKHLSCSVESVLSNILSGKGKVTGRLIDLLIECMDALDKYVEHIRKTSKEGIEENEALIKAFDEYLFTVKEDPKMYVAKVKETKSEKILKKKQDDASIKSEAEKKPATARTVSVDIAKMDELMNQVSELIILKNSFLAMQNQSMHEKIESLERITANLHESVMQVRMVPLESTTNKFPRMLRNLARRLNKRMELYMSGENTELDRAAVDQIGIPLWHLLRNAAEWGIEDREVRWQRNKYEKGAIYLNAYQQDDNVIIHVRDDGNGMDSQKIKESALACGMITEVSAESMSENEILQVVFEPGFSTSKGFVNGNNRGMGLSAARSAVEALGGDMEVSSVLGRGTEFTMRIPLALAIIQAVVVEICQEKYIIALGSVLSIEDISVDEIQHIGSKEMIPFRDMTIPLLYLDRILDAVPCDEERNTLKVILVKKGAKYAGLVVDDLIGQQEIVVKSLGRFIKSGKMISGAAILGDGTAALILDVNALM